ncbi:MAG: DUF4412 domain-containing protein [Candidatus Melainabacteria bacterium]|nr:MAG: DUF4412 domain-containing protein [Candidatus Melainabacteria bacterium]
MDKRFVQKICLALSLIVSSATALPLPIYAGKTPVADSKASSEKLIPAWVINVNSNFAGTVLYCITPNAVRVKFDKLGLVMIIKAPKWNALVYNESNKNYVDLPYEHWKAKFLLRGKRVADKSVVLTPVKTGKKQSILGVPCYQVVVKRKDAKSKNEITMAEAWIAKDIQAPPQFNSMMKTMLDIPIDSGTPMRVFQMGKTSNKMVMVMDCYKAAKTEVKASDFVPLTGYKKVKDEMAMMLDESDDAGADDDESFDAMPKTPVKAPAPVAPPPKKPGGFFDMFKSK